MALFSKLKDRLFKSSSRLEQGLDAIVEDGGEMVTMSAALAVTFSHHLTRSGSASDGG